MHIRFNREIKKNPPEVITSPPDLIINQTWQIIKNSIISKREQKQSEWELESEDYHWYAAIKNKLVGE